MTRRQACQMIGATALAVSWDRVVPFAESDYGAALGALDPHWSWLTDRLGVIRGARPGELPAGAAAGLLVRPEGYVAVLHGDYDEAYTSSLIAHEAWHARQHADGRRYYGRDAEREAWALQAVVLADLAPTSPLVTWLLNSIATLPDGGPLCGNPEV